MRTTVKRVRAVGARAVAPGTQVRTTCPMALAGAVLAGFTLALVAPWLRRRFPHVARIAFAGVPALLALGFARAVPAVSAGTTFAFSVPWIPELAIDFSLRLDGLSLIFALLVTTVGALVALYSTRYIGEHEKAGLFHALLSFFQASMLGLVLAGDLVTLYVFWELTTIASWLLIGHHAERAEAREAAREALLVTSLGGLAMLAGFVGLALAGGTWSLAALPPVAVSWIALCVLLGILAKSAQFPFHLWLPRAMEAPTPASAYLHAATMVTAGIYLAARLAPVLGEATPWQPVLVAAGSATLLAGGVRALLEERYKRVLAFATVSALGLSLLLVGMGSPHAVSAGLGYLVAHAFYKGALFLVAGSVTHATGEDDLERLGGLARAMPWTAGAALLATLSMAGFPLTAGFLFKESALRAAGDWPFLHAVLVCGAALLAAAALLAGARPFLAPGRERPRTQESPAAMWVPAALLAAGGVALGMRPAWVEGLLSRAVADVTGSPGPHLAAWHGLDLTLVLGLGAVATGAALYAVRAPIRRNLLALFPGGERRPAPIWNPAIRAMNAVAGAQTRALQTGLLRDYLCVVLATSLAVVGYAVVTRVELSWPRLATPRPSEIGVAALTIVAAGAGALAHTRFAAVLAVSLAGYGVAFLFLLFGAPDLATTQLVIETLTLVLLVAAFYGLPELAARPPLHVRAGDLVVSCAFGVLAGILVLAASLGGRDAEISRFYGTQSVPEAHGRNVVNVILTDFRAFDTLGEITVLGVAGLGALTLLRRLASRQEPAT